MGFSPTGWGFRNREPRRRVLVHARMRTGTAWVDVSIHNMSSRGLLVQTAVPPMPGTYVEIRRANHVVVGRAVWKAGRRFGVRSQDRLDIDALAGDAVQPGTDAAVRPQPDRRARTRTPGQADALQQFERSRRLSAAMQFMVLLAAVFGAAGIAAGVAYDVLSRPLDAIASRLDGSS